MAFPTIVGTASWQAGSSITAHLATMPAGIQVGDLIVVAWMRGGVNNRGTLDGKWTDLTMTPGGIASIMGVRICYAIADGTESSASLAFTTVSGGARGCSATSVFRGWGRLPEFAATSVTATATTVDPPSLTPANGAQDIIWMAACFMNQASVTLTSVPTNYGNNISSIDQNNTIAFARRSLNAATEDPGVFTWSASANLLADTISIAGPVEIAATLLGSGMANPAPQANMEIDPSAVLGSAWANPAPTELDMDMSPTLLGSGMVAVAPTELDMEVDVTALIGSAWANPAPSSLNIFTEIDPVLLGAGMATPAPQLNMEVDIASVLGSAWTNPTPQFNLEIDIAALLGAGMANPTPTVLADQIVTIPGALGGMTNPAPFVNAGLNIQFSAVLGTPWVVIAPALGMGGAPYTAGNLLMLGVSGRTWARTMPYLLGAISVDIQQPYSVLRDGIWSEQGLVFTLGGRLGVDSELPYTLVGDAYGEVQMVYHLLDASDSQFEEGGLAAPIMGFFDTQSDV